MQAVQQPKPASAQRPVPPLAIRSRPKPSDRRSQEQRLVRDHERLVAAWLRSLSTR